MLSPTDIFVLQYLLPGLAIIGAVVSTVIVVRMDY